MYGRNERFGVGCDEGFEGGGGGGGTWEEENWDRRSRGRVAGSIDGEEVVVGCGSGDGTGWHLRVCRLNWRIDCVRGARCSGLASLGASLHR